jgi:hypothetical protein
MEGERGEERKRSGLLVEVGADDCGEAKSATGRRGESPAERVGIGSDSRERIFVRAMQRLEDLLCEFPEEVTPVSRGLHQRRILNESIEVVR